MRGVELTFEDGPDPVRTPAILDALDAEALRATFFVVGRSAARHPDLIAATLAAGHRVELHCHEHVAHLELGLNALDDDVRNALAVLGEMDVAPRRWRPPWGVLAPWSHLVADAHELELVWWTAGPGGSHGRGAQDMLAALDGELRPGACLKLHDGLGPDAPRSGCAETAELVRRLGPVLRERGLADSAESSRRAGR